MMEAKKRAANLSKADIEELQQHQRRSTQSTNGLCHLLVAMKLNNAQNQPSAQEKYSLVKDKVHANRS